MLPWRKTSDPYSILLSEIMAQQTQVSRVKEYYRRWRKRFPTFSSLAKAPAADVLREWSGLGYNSRALRFHQLAKTVSKQFHSRLPQDPAELQKLPGIGKYTAHAVCCFAFGQHLPVVDVNIKRILTRWTRKVSSSAEMLPEIEAWKTADLFLPVRQTSKWNQALMDLGAMICTARNPKCSDCPIAPHCRSAFSPSFMQKPVRKQKSEPTWKGVPRRIYRGKIVKLLLRHSLSAEVVAASLWKVWSQHDVVWIETVLEAMHREGILSSRQGKYRIAV